MLLYKMSLEPHNRILKSLEAGNTITDLHKQTPTETEGQIKSFYANINKKIDLINKGIYDDSNYIFTRSGNKLHRKDKGDDEDIECEISDFNAETKRKYDGKIKPIKIKSRFSSLSFPSLSFSSFLSRQRGGKRKYTKRRPTKKRRHTKRRPTKRKQRRVTKRRPTKRTQRRVTKRRPTKRRR